MAAASLGINITITGNDFASGALNSAGKNVTGLQKKTMNFGAAAMRIFAGVTAAIGAMKATMKLTDDFANFEQALAETGAILDKDISQLGELRKAALEAGKATQFSPDEAAKGLTELAAKGFDAAESANLLKPALQLAAGGGISVAQASSTAASAVRVFGMGMDEARGAAGKLLRISNLTALRANDLEVALGNVSRGATLTGQSINEMLPAIGLVKNTGVDASVAANSVSSALQFIAKNGDAFEALGVKITDANGNFRQFGDIVLESSAKLRDKYPNAAKRATQALELFGRFGVTAFNAVSSQVEKGVKINGKILQGKDALEALRNEMINAGDAAGKFEERMLNTFKGQATLLKGSAQTFMVVFGEGIAGAIRPLVERAIGTLNRLTDWFDNLPQSTKDSIGQAVSAIGGLVAVVGIVTAVGAALSLLGPAAMYVAGAFVAAGAGAATVSSVLGQGGDQAEALTGQFERIGETLSGFWEPIKSAAMGFFGGIRSGFQEMMSTAGPLLKAVANEAELLVENIKALIPAGESAGGVGKFIGKVLGGAIRFVLGGVQQLMIFVNGLISGMHRMGGVIGPVVDAFSEVGTEVVDLLNQLGFLDSAGSSTASTLSMLGQAVGSILGFAAANIANAVRSIGSILKGLITIFSGVINIIRGIVSGDWTQVWMGIKQVVAGVIKSIIALMGGMVSAIATAIDSVGKLAGKDFGAEAKVRGLQKSMEASIDAALLPPKQVRDGQLAATAPDTSKLDELIANTKVQQPPVPPPNAVPGVAAAKAQPMQLDAASIAAIGAASAKAPAPITKARLILDGQVLGDMVINHMNGGANDATVPVEIQ